MNLYSALYQCADPFGIFDKSIGCVYPEQLTKHGALLLHGGADISPSLYGQKANSYCYAKNTPSDRDKKELAFIDRALDLGIPIIGICRGAQLLCAKAGGTLVQDVTGHEHGDHWLTTKEGYQILGNSVHHQMMNPKGTKHEVIAWSSTSLSKHYMGEDDEDLSMLFEPEIVFFEEINALAIQGHPEYLTPKHPFVKYCTAKIREYFDVL